jgi:hypothetical protein
MRGERRHQRQDSFFRVWPRKIYFLNTPGIAEEMTADKEMFQTDYTIREGARNKSEKTIAKGAVGRCKRLWYINYGGAN